MMNFDQALQSVLQFDIKSHCHVNTNEDGDRFVGIQGRADLQKRSRADREIRIALC